MLKFVDTKVTFGEVPNEISLCINFSNCPYKCVGCHSAYLTDDVGKEFNCIVFSDLLEINHGITCVCFMGGNIKEINYWAEWLRRYYPELKVCWYTGADELTDSTKLKNFDFIKLGHYDENKGPLTSKNTNQKFYEVLLVNKLGKKYMLNDVTHLFWKEQ